MTARIAFRPFYGTIDQGEEISPNLANPLFALLGIRPLAAQHSKLEDRVLRKYAALAQQNIVEIGVAEGGSAVSSRESMPNSSCIYLIDPFLPGRIPFINVVSLVAHKYVNSIRNGSVIWLKDFSFNVIKNWDKNKVIDMLFIDGDHSELGCRQDWEQWSPFVPVGGYVIFHDARIFPGGWPSEEDGPVKVINSLFRNGSLGNSWKIIEEADSLVVTQRQA